MARGGTVPHAEAGDVPARYGAILQRGRLGWLQRTGLVKSAVLFMGCMATRDGWQGATTL